MLKEAQKNEIIGLLNGIRIQAKLRRQNSATQSNK
tara:strand:+ start:193 stop:297 length:105 start_codon:yes stop_codon:yes gene_type:complete